MIIINLNVEEFVKQNLIGIVQANLIKINL